MKIVCFNINGLRARPHQLAAIIDAHQPAVIALQEIKVADEQFPLAEIEALGYRAFYHGQKGHYGVALLSRAEPLSISRGFPDGDPDAQRRLITGRYALPDGRVLTVINGYFPQGESRDHPIKFPAKARFYADLQQYLQGLDLNQPLLLTGDFNISGTDLDIGIGADNARRWLRTGKCSFLPEEREWFQLLMSLGFVDAFRQHQPELAQYSWFDYRSRGFEDDPRRGLRIDLLLQSPALAAQCTASGIDYQIRAMDKPSDHCPIWSQYQF